MISSKIPALFLKQTQGNLKGNLKHQTGGGRYRRVNFPPPYFFRPFLPSPYSVPPPLRQSCYWGPGDGAFPWQLWALPPSTLREIKLKIERKKTSYLFNSLPLNYIYLATWNLSDRADQKGQGGVGGGGVGLLMETWYSRKTC